MSIDGRMSAVPVATVIMQTLTVVALMMVGSSIIINENVNNQVKNIIKLRFVQEELKTKNKRFTLSEDLYPWSKQ